MQQAKESANQTHTVFPHKSIHQGVKEQDLQSRVKTSLTLYQLAEMEIQYTKSLLKQS